MHCHLLPLRGPDAHSRPGSFWRLVNQRNKLLNFFYVRFQFESESSPVEFLQIRELCQQDCKSWLLEEIDKVFLLITVAESTHAAHKIVERNQGYQCSIVASRLGMMMVPDYLNHLGSQVPAFREQFTTFTMSQA